ncbi:hypothetical protein A7982_13261 [Minicystis rosea]|nr:hypothetical protein A7982_13261 [Minicystis rosea]
MSCFVSFPGWALLEESLVRVLARNPGVEIRLYLSMEGIGAAGNAALVDAIVAFLNRHSDLVIGSRPRLQVWIIRDDCRHLFHPKGYAVKAGSRFLTVVGSANTTRAARTGNHEMEAELSDPASFVDFARAAEELEKSGAAVRFNIPNAEELRRFAADKERRRRAFARTMAAARSAGRGEQFARAVEEGPSSVAPISLGPAETLDQIGRAVAAGHRIVYRDGGLPNHSVSLQRFVRAGILAKPTRRTLYAGISVSSQSGSPSVVINLAPDAIVEKMRTINLRQGHLRRLFSIGLLGFHWLPCAWKATFMGYWEVCKTSVRELSIEDVDHHLDDISGWLQRTAFAEELARALRIVPNTGRWDREYIEGTLRDPHLVKLAKAGGVLRSETHGQVYDAICDYVRGEVLDHLDKDDVRLQVESAGGPPRADDPPRPGLGDALDFVATMSEFCVPRRRLDHSLRDDQDLIPDERAVGGGGAGIRRVLAKWAVPSRTLAARIQSNILKIRRLLIGSASVSTDDADHLLIHAWQDLCEVFPERQFPLDWSGKMPPWAPDWSTGLTVQS